MPKGNGEARPRNESFAVRAGDGLTFDFMKMWRAVLPRGCRRVDVPIVLGSRSTDALGAHGGFPSRKLVAGDCCR
jgi:urea carboxylase